MGAAGTALGAADARTNEHYEIGTILTQKSQGGFYSPPTDDDSKADLKKLRRTSKLAVEAVKSTKP